MRVSTVYRGTLPQNARAFTPVSNHTTTNPNSACWWRKGEDGGSHEKKRKEKKRKKEPGTTATRTETERTGTTGPGSEKRAATAAVGKGSKCLLARIFLRSSH